MDIQRFEQSIYKLIVEASTTLPNDVCIAVKRAKNMENEGTLAAIGLDTITQNIQMADDFVLPICQDTGMLTFKIQVPVSTNQIKIERAIELAIIQATKLGKLRINSVNPLTGINSEDNIGLGTPIVKLSQWENDYIDVKLILKGGGCENKNIQYSLPTDLEGIGRAGRDLDGIRKCIMHAVYQAQGQGCSAGFIGVGIGGDRASGYELAKNQLFRQLDDKNENPDLANLESYILENANKLGIGTMGFGGEVTLLGCKIGFANRVPASFFVSVAYNCWAYRRHGVKIDVNNGEIIEWHYSQVEKTNFANTKGSIIDDEKSVISLKAPLSEADIRKLKVGDFVKIDGRIYTGRDSVHKHLSEKDCPVDLNGQIIYHCGPVMIKDKKGAWMVKGAGPTTSIREELYQGDIMRKLGVRAVIGKGGMGAKTLEALGEHGAVYLNAIGGAAQYYSKCVKSVSGVNFLELGVTEAMWHLDVQGFAAVVTMDSHGNSLHADIEKSSLERLKIFEPRVY